MTTVEELGDLLLADMMTDFLSKNLSASDLSNGYVGVSMPKLERKHCKGATAAKVNFDLAMSELERTGLIGTGPIVPYENDPRSSVLVLALYSKREYACLTQKGYKAALKMNQKPPPGQPTVVISGGNFHQSPIGVGNHVRQTLHVDIANEREVVEYLCKLLESDRGSVSSASKSEVAELVTITKQGDMAAAKPLFKKLFGVAKEGAKQLAWGVLSAIVAKQLGM